MTANRIYLIVADDTAEFDNALQYACKAAKANGTHIGVLYVMPDAGFENWGNLEERIKQDRRNDAERLLQEVAERIKVISGLVPTLYVGDGKAYDAIVDTIKNNPDISNLFLGASTKSGGPGPLVKYFMGKGISKLPVPLTIIPDHIAIPSKPAEI